MRIIQVASVLVAVAACSKGGGDKQPAVQEHGAAAAKFSLKVNGAAVTGGVIDDMQLHNAARIVQRSGADQVLLYLADDPFPGRPIAHHSLRLLFPKQTGAVTGPISIDVQYTADHSVRYSGEASYSVTTLSATRVSGTFSTGSLGNTPDFHPAAGEEHATLTEGTFDVPFSTSNVSPE